MRPGWGRRSCRESPRRPSRWGMWGAYGAYGAQARTGSWHGTGPLPFPAGRQTLLQCTCLVLAATRQCHCMCVQLLPTWLLLTWPRLAPPPPPPPGAARVQACALRYTPSASCVVKAVEHKRTCTEADLQQVGGGGRGCARMWRGAGWVAVCTCAHVWVCCRDSCRGGLFPCIRDELLGKRGPFI